MKIRKPPPLQRDDEPQIDTPVIDMQDLEHQPTIETRVNNAGIGVLPEIDLSKDEEKARQAIEAIETGVFSPDDVGRFAALMNALRHSDYYMVTADFDAYYKAKKWRLAQLPTTQCGGRSVDFNRTNGTEAEYGQFGR